MLSGYMCLMEINNKYGMEELQENTNHILSTGMEQLQENTDHILSTGMEQLQENTDHIHLYVSRLKGLNTIKKDKLMSALQIYQAINTECVLCLLK